MHAYLVTYKGVQERKMHAYLVTYKGVTKQVMANSEFDARVRGALELPHTVSDRLSDIKVMCLDEIEQQK